jgi:hypothetical protein
MTSILYIVLNIIAPVFMIVGLAVLVDRHFKVDPRPLSRIVFFLFSPALVLKGLAQTDLQAEELGRIALLAVLLYASMLLVGWTLARLNGFDRRLQSSFMLCVVLINAGNYGLPLTEFAFGPAGLQRAIVFFVCTAIMTNTVGVFLASRGAASVKRSLFNIFTVPLPYAVMVGLLFNFSHITLPLFVERAITLLSQAAVPGMLVILGLQLARTTVTGRLRPISLASGVRLMVAPVITLLLTMLLGLTGVTRQVLVIQASMPTAVISTVLAAEFGSDVDFAVGVLWLIM